LDDVLELTDLNVGLSVALLVRLGDLEALGLENVVELSEKTHAITVTLELLRDHVVVLRLNNELFDIVHRLVELLEVLFDPLLSDLIALADNPRNELLNFVNSHLGSRLDSVARRLSIKLHETNVSQRG